MNFRVTDILSKAEPITVTGYAHDKTNISYQTPGENGSAETSEFLNFPLEANSSYECFEYQEKVKNPNRYIHRNHEIWIDAAISSSTSDTFCGYVTDIKERRRKLYTDNETIDYDICQPVILMGIHDVIKNEDMLSRSMIPDFGEICE